MTWAKLRGRRLDLQAKISLTLIGVILPIFVIMTVLENKLTRPILEDDMRQVGVTTGKTVAAEIVGARLLNAPVPTDAMDRILQEHLVSQPSIIRMDILTKNPVSGKVEIVASNFEVDPNTVTVPASLVDAVTTEFRLEDYSTERATDAGYWDIYVPIERRSRAGEVKLLGNVHLILSMKPMDRIVSTLWKITGTGAAASLLALILALSYFLQKTIENDRRLRKAQTENIQLTQQLHEAQRQLMNNEKLAVMGQLTASFAHEIGTPLNAIGGHLQLIQEDLPSSGSAASERLEIIQGQLSKIEAIVKSFLQSTAKPISQKQLVDVNQMVDRAIEIAKPRMASLSESIEIKRQLNRKMGPLRAVPLELEQILLNLLNNSIDSLREKNQSREKGRLVIEVSTDLAELEGKQWAEVSVYDTGRGIKKEDLGNVLKPFFTTKPAGEGTGLGLAICSQLAHKYGGALEIDSKEGAWTRVNLRLPYHATT